MCGSGFVNDYSSQPELGHDDSFHFHTATVTVRVVLVLNVQGASNKNSVKNMHAVGVRPVGDHQPFDV